LYLSPFRLEGLFPLTAKLFFLLVFVPSLPPHISYPGRPDEHVTSSCYPSTPVPAKKAGSKDYLGISENEEQESLKRVMIFGSEGMNGL
jgi:hypothetical protein